jgi:hypothetical protein
MSNHNDELRKRTGAKRADDGLISFLYELMRDHLPAGVVEKLVQNVVDEQPKYPIVFTNGYLADYAADLAARITNTPKKDL